MGRYEQGISGRGRPFPLSTFARWEVSGPGGPRWVGRDCGMGIGLERVQLALPGGARPPRSFDACGPLFPAAACPRTPSGVDAHQGRRPGRRPDRNDATVRRSDGSAADPDPSRGRRPRGMLRSGWRRARRPFRERPRNPPAGCGTHVAVWPAPPLQRGPPHCDPGLRPHHSRVRCRRRARQERGFRGTGVFVAASWLFDSLQGMDLDGRVQRKV